MRLIDADAFRRELDKHYPFTKEEQSKHGIADIAKSVLLSILMGMPTIEERTKGKWIWDDEGYHCSECFFHAYENALECYEGIYRYCPNCGADMRGEGNG